MIKSTLRSWLDVLLLKFDAKIISTKLPYLGLDKRTVDDIKACESFTLTPVERLIAIDESVEYLERQHIEGDIVECGVWRGGSSMMIAKALMRHGNLTRSLYLYDTYEGMSEPTEHDVSLHGAAAEKKYDSTIKDGHSDWCYASIEDVRANMRTTGYEETKLHFVKGKVENTIPQTIPEKISLLRLDTDWYESTKHEMDQLYPRLVSGGILIIDDYGHWQGARKAIDEYFDARGGRPFMHRIDYSSRLLIKP